MFDYHLKKLDESGVLDQIKWKYIKASALSLNPRDLNCELEKDEAQQHQDLPELLDGCFQKLHLCQKDLVLRQLLLVPEDRFQFRACHHLANLGINALLASQETLVPEGRVLMS